MSVEDYRNVQYDEEEKLYLFEEVGNEESSTWDIQTVRDVLNRQDFELKNVGLSKDQEYVKQGVEVSYSPDEGLLEVDLDGEKLSPTRENEMMMQFETGNAAEYLFNLLFEERNNEKKTVSEIMREN